MCRLEALARWEDPTHGSISPDVFVPALERTHQIERLDAHIFRLICRKLREELDAGREALPVSFNISRLDFYSCDVLKMLECSVSAYSLPRSLLLVEVTETIMVWTDWSRPKSAEYARLVIMCVWTTLAADIYR